MNIINLEPIFCFRSRMFPYLKVAPSPIHQPSLKQPTTPFKKNEYAVSYGYFPKQYIV